MLKKLILALLMLFPASAFAAGPYYVDSSWAGTHSGTAAAPWCSIYQGWGTINAELATLDVVVYFSAANPTGTGNSVYTGNSANQCNGGGGSAGRVDMSSKTTAAHKLTLDGHSFYNTSEVNPSWSANTTSYHNQMFSNFSQNSGNSKKSNYVVDGFDLRANAGEKAIAICGDDVIIRNNVLTNTFSGNQPAMLVVPTADSAHEGSSEPCPVMNNVQIYNNTISPVDSEAIYVGGGGCRHADITGLDDGSGATLSITIASGSPSASSLVSGGIGYSVGQLIYARGNLFNGGGVVAEDDHNDVGVTILTVDGSGTILTISAASIVGNNSPPMTGSKSAATYATTNNCQGFPAHTNVEIYGNKISGVNYRSAEGDGIDVKGGLVGLRIHDNYIHNLLAFRCIVTQGMNTSDADPDNRVYGNQCVNSVYTDAAITFANTWGTPRGWSTFNNIISNVTGSGIFTYACSTPWLVANNTLYSVSGTGISSCGTVKNNAILSNGSPASGGTTGSFNAFSGTWAGCTPSCQTSLTSGSFVDVTAKDFRILNTSQTKLYHAGDDLSGLGITALNSDINGVARGATWDIGAYQYVARPTPGNSGAITTSSVGTTTLTLTWTTTGDATDQYEVCRSSSNNVSTPLDCENAEIIKSYTANIGTFNVTGLVPGSTNYFNVVVKTTGGGNNAYVPVSATTSCGTPAILAFTSQPHGAAVGSSLGTVIVAIENDAGAVCWDSTALIVLSKNASATWGSLSSGSSLSKSAVAGYATWTDLAVNTPGAGAIDANSSGLTAATSNSVTIGGIQLIGTAAENNSASASTLAVTLTGTTAGDFIAVGIRTAIVSTVVNSVADNCGNSYVRRAGRVFRSGFGGIEIWAAENIAGGTCLITMTSSASVETFMAAAEFTGIATSSSFDVASTDTGSSAAPSSGAQNTSQADELILGALGNGNASGAFTPGSGFASLSDQTLASAFHFEYRVVNSTGSYAADGTIAVSGGWSMAMAAFKANNASGPPVPGASGDITTAAVAPTTLTLNWTKATSPTDAPSDLQYEVCQSTTNTISTVGGCEAATIIRSFTADIATFNVTGLTALTTYYFNVIVKDLSGNKVPYSTKTQATTCGATKVVFTSQPASAILGASLGTVFVSVENAASTVCTDATNSITLSKNGSATWGTLASASNLTKSAVAGVATWTDLTITTTAGSGSIDAASSGLTGATSNSITISPSGSPFHAGKFRIRR